VSVFLGPGPSAQIHEALELFMPLNGDISTFLLSTIGNSTDLLEGRPMEADILWFALLEKDLGAKTKEKSGIKEGRLGVRTVAIGKQNNTKQTQKDSPSSSLAPA